MKFALCNEMFGSMPFEQAFATTRNLGYTGIEIAPFTLAEGETVDIRDVSDAKLAEVKKQAADAGLQVVGLHWLLAKTTGFYLTSPDAEVRRNTAEYLQALATACGKLGGTIMVLGSPQQRNLLPGVTYEQAEEYAAEVLRAAMPVCADNNVTIALEPLGPAEGDFMMTADSGVQLAKLVDSPNCQLHLDVKAMSSESDPIAQVIREHSEWMVHFHANDPNLLGPGMGDVEFAPIFAALSDVGYTGWVSVEVFKYEPSPEEIARVSMEYMQQFV
ncbi:sugar phosphate isomerase/epimerase family protein [Aeoliella mucimassa]|uniref:D-tagatose 3-epimerase n=1 Tax=Aeoliella mucimassa TaxID=2527972 RepID=A0A518AJK0_9BACT|nr:sugar phosphate isomerase/epimerase family protein [Aeoliella mucimassa]QDU54854.1 D-tagatose 3-epimerase [Aeoliella mucimassa]